MAQLRDNVNLFEKYAESFEIMNYGFILTVVIENKNIFKKQCYFT